MGAIYKFIDVPEDQHIEETEKIDDLIIGHGEYDTPYLKQYLNEGFNVSMLSALGSTWKVSVYGKEKDANLL